TIRWILSWWKSLLTLDRLLSVYGSPVSLWKPINTYPPPWFLIAYQDDVTSQAIVPLETPSSAIAEYVYPITRTVFEAFEGVEIDISVIEDLIQRLIERRR
ncbi:unnamed protein product, partial [marine sediment metagenome]